MNLIAISMKMLVYLSCVGVFLFFCLSFYYIVFDCFLVFVFMLYLCFFVQEFEFDDEVENEVDDRFMFMI